jgi:hypothetical protein
MNNELNMNHSIPMTLKVGETVLIEMEDITVPGIVSDKTSVKMDEAGRITAFYDIEHLARPPGAKMWEPTSTRFFQRTDGIIYTPKDHWQLRQVAEQTQKVRGL